jgi:pimeloyl-ACP methyl ester carboxylesterase
MNAALDCVTAEITGPIGARLPELAWRRLRLSLRRARANGEAWDACIRYGAPLPAVERLLDYWCDELDCRAVEARLNALPLFEWRAAGDELAFIHARAPDDAALPLLWLHGASGSLAEGLCVVAGLTTPARQGDAFHVVCPSLPGRAAASAATDGALASVAARYASLMATLGYDRYAVHGSGLGARVAAELCRLDAPHVVALHVTSLGALPSPDELVDLNTDEKSRLLSLHAFDAISRQPDPPTPVEQLALAACQLADGDGDASLVELAAELLWGLSYDILRCQPEFRQQLAQQEAVPIVTRSEVPASVCSFPLGRASLRRFVERAQRVVAWSEQDYGGELAALEQPQVLLGSLRSLCSALR